MYGEEHLCMHNTLNLETDEQQKTTQCAPPLSAKNTKWMPQLTQAQQNWTVGDWENVAWSFFCCNIQMADSEFGLNNLKT